MKNEKTSIYITSWASYNEGLGRGGWLALEETNEETFIEDMKKIGLDPEGFDEELVIHDYDDYEFEGGLYKLFGEAYPLTVIKFYEKWEELEEDEKLAFIGLLKDQGASIALEALEENALDCYLVMSEEGFEEYCRECLSCSVDSGAWDYLESYIDWDQVYREYGWDFSTFDYDNITYYMREN